LTDDREGIERHDDRPLGPSPGHHEAGNVRRPYTAPELIEYGTVAKLTQTGSGSVFDFGGMMTMMP
jgi:hypothetical protein